jgi:hypothetical protein
MKRRIRNTISTLGLTLAAAPLLFACGGDQQQSDEVTKASNNIEQKLNMEQTDIGIQGTFVYGDTELKFSSEEIGPSSYDLWIELNGMTLTAVYMPQTFAIDYDGFITDSGDAPWYQRADRKIIRAFSLALDNVVEDEGEFNPGWALNRATRYWGDVPDNFRLQLEVLSDMNQGTNRICGEAWKLLTFTHDCQYGSESYTKNKRPLNIAWRNNGVEEFCVNGNWTTNATYKNHSWANWPAISGGCMSHCGANCPSCDKNQVLTHDCAKHDLCVEMHGQNGGPCEDELIAAADDYGASNCNSTKCEHNATKTRLPTSCN